MSRASGCLWLAVGLVLALAAGGVAFLTLQRAALSQQAGPVETRSALVAARPVAPGTLLSENDVILQEFPATALPAGALTSLADARGKVTMIPLNTGEMLLAHHLTQPDINAANLGFTLPSGKIAVALAADDLLSSARLIQVGTRVDILYSLRIPPEAMASSTANGASRAGSDKLQYTFGALQGAQVIATIQATGGEQAQNAAAGLAGGAGAKGVLGSVSAYILALDAQDALILKYLRDADAIMDLAIRNVSDDVEHEMRPVDLQYLIDKYQLQGP